MIKEYYELAKPGIVYGNAWPAIAGFFFASTGAIAWGVFFAMLMGLSFVIGSACALNNIHDRAIDARMERTKHRGVASGRIPRANALIFAIVLGLLGAALLGFYTTPLALYAALAGFGIYVFLYTPLKPKTPLALFVGAVAGATPPVVGYAAAANVYDWYALALFAALFVWQIPHFLSIAMYRYAEYAAAGVPLYIKKEPSEPAKRRARLVFYLSLVVLLFGCAALILQRWIR
jgi:protoheme IX farnesyltransferase